MGWFRLSCRLILLPSFVGLACSACTTAVDTSLESQLSDTRAEGIDLAETEQEERIKNHTADGSIDTDTPQALTAQTTLESSSAEAVRIYQEGTRLAASAEALTQSALSPDDWGLIASRWQRAADLLEQIEPNRENYESAQRKTLEYALNAESAIAQIDQLQAPEYVPLATLPTAVVPAPRTSAPPATAPESTSSSQRVQVPIVRRLHGTPVVQVTFNGTRRYDMILDTGASRTLITRKMADDLGIVTTDRMVAATASQAEVSFDIGTMRSIAVGDVVLENSPVSIGDAVSIGLLGNDFLRDYDVTIRSQEGVVELMRAY